MKNQKRKNILLITSDQQHWDTLGAFNKEISTPNLDRLIEEGMVFDRAYCPNPTCTPTRASMITGLYPSQHGAWSLGTKLPEETETIGSILKEEGYKTALIGKAHFQHNLQNKKYPSLEAMPLLQDLEFWRNFDEEFYGFDTIELTRNHTNEFLVGQHYAIWMEDNGLDNWRDYFSAPTGTMDPEKKHVWEIPEKYHYNAWIAERTNGLLKNYKENDENFFLWSSFFDPHPPYFVPEPWASMYDPNEITISGYAEGEHEKNPPHFAMTQEQAPDYSTYFEPEDKNWLHGCHSHIQDEQSLRKDIAIYYGMISMMDEYIGKILNQLDELGIADETLVVFTTDHGHFFGHHGLTAKGPFHYEDMIKVPMIARDNKEIKSGSVNSSFQSLVDFTPTFLEWVGLKVPRTMSGISQAEVWKGNSESVRDHIIVENQHTATTMNLRTYVNERYKITVYFNNEYGELYDLQNDPKEVHNLWDNPEIEALKSELLVKFMWAEMGKVPLWMPRVSLA